MEWAEIKRRLKNGTSVQVLADLEAIPYKTMYNRIMAHQVKDGVTYLTPENTKGMKKAKAISDTKQKQAKEKEKAAGLPEDEKESLCDSCENTGKSKWCSGSNGKAWVCSDYKKKPEESQDLPEVMPVIVTNDYSCKGCAHCIQTSFGLLCKLGHECGENCVCSDYKAFPKPAQEEKPEFLQKKMNLPEDVPKLPEDKPLIIPFPDPEKVGLCPEVMEMLRENCEACIKLAESYARQASEYAHLLKRYGVDIPAAQKKKDEDLRRKLAETFGGAVTWEN